MPPHSLRTCLSRPDSYNVGIEFDVAAVQSAGFLWSPSRPEMEQHSNRELVFRTRDQENS